MALRSWHCFALATITTACAPAPRFALRPPVTHEPDMRPIARRPASRDTTNVSFAIDQAFLRPMSHVFAFERADEAIDVNALDEVPDSSWFTNRVPSAADMANGPCGDQPLPRAPFTVLSGKVGGLTPGLVVRDALGRRYVFKLDAHPLEQPELSTGADAVTARLYWAAGYFTSCNQVVDVAQSDFTLDPHAHFENDLGHRHPLTRGQLDDALIRGVHRADGTTRFGASLFIEGTPIGPWAIEGTRADDPNDVVPHERRRELRGERLLAAWVNHWDSREPNSLDSFVETSPHHGYVRHWIIDFGDTLGSAPLEYGRAATMGYTHWIHPGIVIEDFFAFGAMRRPWDDSRPDPVAPTLGYFDVARFEPAHWVSSNPLTRFAFAREEDMAWMARRIARITPAHIRVAVAQGGFTDARVRDRLVDILVGRRARLLRWSARHVAPLMDAIVRDDTRVCATDFAVSEGLSPLARVNYRASLREGSSLRPSAHGPTIEAGTHPGEVCFRLQHFARETLRDPDPARYAVLHVERREGDHTTHFDAHLYDLDARGFFIAGIER